jgi:hypothetical protein
MDIILCILIQLIYPFIILIIRKAKVNNAGDIYQPTWEQIGDTDIYVADISGQTRNDFHFYVDAYNGDNYTIYHLILSQYLKLNRITAL